MNALRRGESKPIERLPGSGPGSSIEPIPYPLPGIKECFSAWHGAFELEQEHHHEQERRCDSVRLWRLRWLGNLRERDYPAVPGSAWCLGSMLRTEYSPDARDQPPHWQGNVRDSQCADKSGTH